MTESAATAITPRDLLRHTVAVVAYRGAKSLRGAPPEFATFKPGPTSRQPIEILSHVNDLYDWALWMAKGKWTWSESTPGTWDHEVSRFHAGLAAFDAYLAGDGPLGHSAEALVAGPISGRSTCCGVLPGRR
jgi:hypothetical protein